MPACGWSRLSVRSSTACSSGYESEKIGFRPIVERADVRERRFVLDRFAKPTRKVAEKKSIEPDLQARLEVADDGLLLIYVHLGPHAPPLTRRT